MEQQLSIINNIACVRKRIKGEIDILIKENICIKDDVKITESNPKYSYYIEFKNLKNKNYYTFEITSNYPFIPPKLFINNKSINFYYQIKNLEFSRKLRKYTGTDCFCCQSKLCSTNWNPQYTFNNILDDINKYRDICYQIVLRIIIDVIKRKYLIDDTNIIEWLY